MNNINRWETLVEEMFKESGSNLLKQAFRVKETPVISSAVSYLKNAQNPDGYWAVDNIVSTKEQLSFIASCTAYICLIMSRIERKKNILVSNGLLWIEKKFNDILNTKNIFDLANVAYYLTRNYRVTEPKPQYLEMASEIMGKAISLQNKKDKGWGQYIDEEQSNPTATMAVMHALYAISPTEYSATIQQARSFLEQVDEWNDLLEVSNVCTMMLETGEHRDSELILKLINEIRKNILQKGHLRRANEPDVLTTSIGLRALNLYGEPLDSRGVQRGMEFLMDSFDAVTGGWPRDTNRHVCDPWTTIDVLHTLLHMERVIRTNTAFNIMHEFKACLKERVLFPLAKTIQDKTLNQEKLEKKIAEFQNESVIRREEVQRISTLKDALEKRVRMLEIEKQNLSSELTNQLTKYRSDVEKAGKVEELRAINQKFETRIKDIEGQLQRQTASSNFWKTTSISILVAIVVGIAIALYFSKRPSQSPSTMKKNIGSIMQPFKNEELRGIHR